MNVFVSKLLSNNLLEARKELETKINNLVNEKLNQVKMRVAAEMSEQFGIDIDYEEVNEGNVVRMGRTKLIKIRVRRGKIQRRVKKSAVPGYTMRAGKLTRMMPQERRHRKLAARRSKFRRRAKIKQSLRKRRISLRKRTALGL